MCHWIADTADGATWVVAVDSGLNTGSVALDKSGAADKITARWGTNRVAIFWGFRASLTILAACFERIRGDTCVTAHAGFCAEVLAAKAFADRADTEGIKTTIDVFGASDALTAVVADQAVGTAFRRARPGRRAFIGVEVAILGFQTSASLAAGEAKVVFDID